MPLHIVHEDITRMRVDAVVNAANEGLRQGGGVCGAIFAAAGARELQAACDQIGHCATGSAVATDAFRLPAKHVIHAVGPIWRGGGAGEETALRSCYRSALELACDLDDTSIAFPLISSGIYGYPKDAAADVALQEIGSFLATHELEVFLSILDTRSLREGSTKFAPLAALLASKAEPLELHAPYAFQKEPDEAAADVLWDESPNVLGGARARSCEQAAPSRPARASAASRAPMAPMPDVASASPHQGFLKRLLSHMDAPFSVTLLRMIDERGLKDSDVYKRANMTRQHFSKIRSRRGYQPKKQTVLALAIALELSIDETKLLLERAGYALSHADERDMIVEYFIRNRTYDINEINLALYAFDQPLLD